MTGSPLHRILRREQLDFRFTEQQEEIFGPVLSVIWIKDEEHAVKIANDTKYGLASGVWTRGLSRAHRFARRIQAGTVLANTYWNTAAQSPTGGVRQSGYGRKQGDRPCCNIRV